MKQNEIVDITDTICQPEATEMDHLKLEVEKELGMIQSDVSNCVSTDKESLQMLLKK